MKMIGNAQELQYVFAPEEKDKGTSKLFESYWTSPEAFARHVEEMDPKKAWCDDCWTEGNPKWYGTDNMEQAVQLAQTGWEEGVLKVEALQKNILVRHPLQLKPVQYGIAGAYPNVARAIAGDPFNMRIPDLAKASKRPVLTLLSDIGTNCGGKAEALLNRAAVVAALVDQIEAAGYSTEVVAFAGVYSWADSTKVRIYVQVKNSNQPVDIARLAFGLGHPGMFRRLSFAEFGHDSFTEGLGDRLGSHMDHGKTASDKVFIVPPIQGTNKFNTEELAATEGVEYIIDKLKEQGFPPFKGVETTKSKELVDSDDFEFDDFDDD